MDDLQYGPETLISHYAEDPRLQMGAVTPPIYQTSLFTFERCEDLLNWVKRENYFYTRVNNPTTEVLQQKLAALEGAEHALLFASGMGAISAAILSVVGAGKHVVCVDTVYGPTRTLLETLQERFDVDVSFIPGLQPEEWAQAARPNTALFYLETPSSFLFRLQDFEAIAAIAKPRGIVTMTDNSWCSPLFCNPHKLGIDLVLHSATKYIGGHSDVLGGVIAGSGALMRRIMNYEMLLLGATPDPFASFLLTRGLRTLPLRMERHQTSALRLAAWLEQHRKVARVWHPGLPSHPQHELAQRMLKGFSGVFSLRLADPSKENTFRFIESLKLFAIGCSWGGHESLALPHELKGDAVEADGWIARLSIGFENFEDLQADLEAAL